MEEEKSDSLLKKQKGHRSRGAPKKVKYYQFSPAFDQPAAKYVEGVLRDVMKLPMLELKLRSLSHGQKTQIFKDMIAFQEQHYYPPWIKFVDEVADALGRVGRSKRFKSAFLDRIPYWVITLLTWKQALEKLRPPLS